MRTAKNRGKAMTEAEGVAFVETKRRARALRRARPTLRVVLDTCILKLATFPAEHNASALIYELARAGLTEAWVTPAILEEYADVLGDYPEFVAEIVECFPVCDPLTELSVIRHEPDNRFLECALERMRNSLSRDSQEHATANRLGGCADPAIR
ncbi:MAG TPA: PIN domain-containing protein [Vicinamibacterales bacterium]|nr:PIN domain-containing protein [Vicinamibacterales bacterium]